MVFMLLHNLEQCYVDRLLTTYDIIPLGHYAIASDDSIDSLLFVVRAVDCIHALM